MLVVIGDTGVDFVRKEDGGNVAGQDSGGHAAKRMVVVVGDVGDVGFDFLREENGAEVVGEIVIDVRDRSFG